MTVTERREKREQRTTKTSNNPRTHTRSHMSIYADEIDKIYRLAKEIPKGSIGSFSQVGEKYDPKKFGFEQVHIDGKSQGGSHEQ